jgi:hypothetical protein
LWLRPSARCGIAALPAVVAVPARIKYVSACVKYVPARMKYPRPFGLAAVGATISFRELRLARRLAR